MDFTAPDPPDEQISVVAFPVLHQDALCGLPGKIVEAVAPHTEAHPAAILVQFLARFGCTAGPKPHVFVDNREHPARLWPLIVGKTSDGAKGTSYGVVAALFGAVEQYLDATPTTWRHPTLRRVSGMSSGEGLIELVRDQKGSSGEKDFDEGIDDKRLLVVEQEFTSALAVMERQGSTLPRVVREAWDGDPLRTLTRSALTATETHISVIGHVTPGELRLRLKEAQVLGGTMNRTLPTASRRTKLLPDGGNVPPEVLGEFADATGQALLTAGDCRRVERSAAAMGLWRDRYPWLRRARPDGPVASILARAAPQVIRLALAYALADGARVIDEEHLAAALAIWAYTEDTAEWMFGLHVDSAAVDALVGYISAGGRQGRTRTQISVEHFGKHKPAGEITAQLAELMRDGRVREEIDKSGAGRPVARYFPC